MKKDISWLTQLSLTITWPAKTSQIQPTLWLSKHLMNWCAVTQLPHRKLAQSVHRATAFSRARQLVHTIGVSSVTIGSTESRSTRSDGKTDRPLAGTGVSCLQFGHVIVGAAMKLPSFTIFCWMTSKHGKHATWRQFKTLGCFSFSWQSGQLVVSSQRPGDREWRLESSMDSESTHAIVQYWWCEVTVHVGYGQNM